MLVPFEALVDILESGDDDYFAAPVVILVVLYEELPTS